jgi:hypothetical protein
MGVKEILGYICLAGAVISFVTMYVLPHGKRNPTRAKGEERLILRGIKCEATP